MARAAGSQGAKSDNPAHSFAERRDQSQEGTDSVDVRLEGLVCRFQPVRSAGDAEVTRIAALQHGHVHRRQLDAAGIGRHGVERRVRIGWLRAVLPSVYAVAGVRRDPLARLMAAALYFRGDALIGCRSAAHAWGLLDTTQQLRDGDPVEVLLPGRNAVPPAGIRMRRVKALARQDVRWRNGIPLTSPARTLLDLAANMDELELETALSAAFRRHLVRRSNLRDVMERNPRAKGIGLLRSLLEQTESLHDTRSKYERKLLNLLRAAELPLPITNVSVANRPVDGLWPDLKLVYEFDGWLYHRDKFESDRLRDQHMLIAGHRVVRITRRQIDFTPYALVARFASVITTLTLERDGTLAAGQTRMTT